MFKPNFKAALRSGWELLRETFSEWMEDKVPRLGAALAFYTMFSLAPLLILVISFAGLIFGEEAARGHIEDQLKGLVGQDGAALIQSWVQKAGEDKQAGVLATAIGILTLLFGATGVFGQLQDALNTIWGVAPRPGRRILGIVKDRFAGFTMVGGIGFLLLVSLVLSAALAAMGNYLGGLIPNFVIGMKIVQFVLTFGVFTLLFAMIFKILPDVRIAWKDIWVGALVTAFLFTVGKFLIGLYLGRGVASAYGAAGSLVVLLLWIYYSAQILFLGAEFTQVYARKYGTRIVPSANAVALTPEARAHQGIPRREDLEEALAPGGKAAACPEVRKAARKVVIVERRAGGPLPGLLAFLLGFLIGRRGRGVA